MQTRAKTISSSFVAAAISFVASFKLFDWALIVYWEWQHQRKMKFTFWADSRALLLAICFCSVVFYTTTRYIQRKMPADQQMRRRSLVLGTVLGAVLVLFSIVAYVLVVTSRFSS